MHFPADKLCRNLFVFAIGVGATVCPACAQTVRVDVAPAHALAFDPDKAMGSSMDILPAKDFDTVYSEPIIKESLSAGWGPITYRQNTELTIGAWHWNPKGTWSDAKSQSGYFVGSAQPGDSLRQSFGYKLPHRRFDEERRGTKRVFADNGWRRLQLLEKQSVSGREIHR